MEEIISFVGILGYLYLIHEIHEGVKTIQYRGFVVNKLYNHYYIVGITGEFSSRRATEKYIDNYIENYSNES